MRRSSGLATAWGLCVLLCLWGEAVGESMKFIDVLRPVVRRSPAQTADAFFGYTVVLHQLEANPGDFEEALSQTRVIVAAPRGTYPGGLSLPDTPSPENLTGLIYDCPVQQGSCGGLLGTEEGEDLRLFDPEPDNADNFTGEAIEQKSEQFLGGTMYSTGDFFLVCAPRWASRPVGAQIEDNRRTYGRCYVSNRSLQNFDTLQPCDSPTTPNQRSGDVHCSAGVGSLLFQNQAGPGLVLGAPGFESSIGRLYFYELALSGEVNQTSRTSGEAGVSYSYLGYTVATGRIRSASGLDLLASRPRFDRGTYMGQVQVFSFEDVTNLDLQTVDGTQTGEYFGFSIATADLNNDGFDELLVGAPMYSIPGDPSRGRAAVPEIGRVYVFENVNGMLRDTPITLEGTDVAYSRFGHAIVNVGDINDDGYDDVAIGAPFMPDPQNPNANGTVFIYYGAGDDIITNSPQQIILASDVLSAIEGLDELKTFGYSLASGVDVDANEYQDLAVGAISSQVVVVFRTHSMARIDVEFTPLVDTVDVEDRNCNESLFACFNVSMCARYSGRGLSGELVLNLEVAENRGVTLTDEQRLQFGSDPDEPYSQPFVFTNASETTCEIITVYVKSTTIRELTPFTVDASFSTLPLPAQTIDGNQALTDLTLTPLLEINGNTTVEVALATRCGDDEICHSDLRLDLVEVTFTNASNAPFASFSTDRLVVDETRFVNVILAYNNTAEDAFGTRLDFSLPDGIFRLFRVVSAPNTACTRVGTTGENYTCELMSPLRREDRSSMLTLQWAVQNLNGDEGSFTIPIRISIPDSAMNIENATDLNDNVVSIPFVIAAEANLAVQTSFSPTNAPYSAMNPLGDSPTDTLAAFDLGTQFNLNADVTTQGPTIISSFQLEIVVPFRSNETGNFTYLYPFEVSSTPSMSATCSDTGLNPDMRPLQSGSESRRKRRVVSSMTEPHRREALNRVRRQDTAFTRSCDSDFVECLVIQCEIIAPTIDVSMSVTLEGFVDGRFFAGRMDTFNFVASATVSIPGGIVIDPNSADNTDTATLTVSPEQVVEEGGGKDVPWWVYFVSIFGALVIVIAIIICLYFFGFFRRKKHELEKKEAEGDFEVPAELVGGGTGGVAGGVAGGMTVGVVGGTADDVAMEYNEEKPPFEDETKEERVATSSPPPQPEKETSPGPVVESAAAVGGAGVVGGAGPETEVAVELEPGPEKADLGETDFGYQGDIGGTDDFETEL